MDGISFYFRITNILLAIFILSITLQISEGFNLNHKNYIKRDYRNLGRLRRQIIGPPCKRYDQFECSNGQCIHSDDECNGVAECDDKSDETEQGCHRFYCPDYLYKCEYGACVNGDAKCNGHQDCIDNSDEDEKICNTTNPRVNIDIPKDGKKCTTPQQPKHGQWIYSGNPRRPDPNVQVDSSTVIIFSCDPGYKVSGINGPKLLVACEESGQWTATVAFTCQKDLCEPNPCGANTYCEPAFEPRNPSKERPVCFCHTGFVGNPITGCQRGECVADSECPNNKACIDYACQNPCIGQCGINAECNPRNHVAFCTCPTGYQGDAISQCNINRGTSAARYLRYKRALEELRANGTLVDEV